MTWKSKILLCSVIVKILLLFSVIIFPAWIESRLYSVYPIYNKNQENLQ